MHTLQEWGQSREVGRPDKGIECSRLLFKRLDLASVFSAYLLVHSLTVDLHMRRCVQDQFIAQLPGFLEGGCCPPIFPICIVLISCGTMLQEIIKNHLATFEVAYPGKVVANVSKSVYDRPICMLGG